MKRIIMMVLRNFFYVIVSLIRFRWYYTHRDRYSDEKINEFYRDICKHAVKGGNIEIEISGVENFPEEKGFLIYPNHQGMFDVLAIVLTCPYPVTVIAKKETEKVPILRSFLSLMGAQLIDREDLRQSMQVINTVAKETKEGKNYIIFAEGTRSRNGNHLLEFKAGSFKAATKAGSPIVPIALVDSYKAFDTDSLEKITIRTFVLEPIYPEQYKGMNTVEIANMVQSRIENVVKNYY